MLTPDQIQNLKANMPGATPSGTPSPTAPATHDWVDSLVNSNSQNTRLISDIQNIQREATKSGVQQTKEGFAQGMNAKNPLELIEGGLKTGAGVVNTALSPLAPIFTPVSKGVNAVSNYISDNPGIQKFAQTQTGKNVARGAEDIANASTIAGALAGGEKAPEIKSAVNNTINTVKSNIPKVPDIKAGLSDIYKNQSIKDWTEPTTIPSASYNRATKIFKNSGSNISETLVNNGVKLSDNIQNGKYATRDTAEILREDAGKTSADLLRPSLEAANTTVAKVPIASILETAKSVITSNKEMTLGDKQTAIARLNKEGSALQKEYPRGMSLTDLHDNKITYSKNAGHNPVGTRADNITANMNNAIADSLKTTLEKNAPKEIPVKEFNAELSKQYKAADYLDALHGKSVPRGIGSKIMQQGAKLAGVAGGEMIAPGILGGVAGYHLGGVIENMLENMSNPVKSHFLNNLEKTNPEAFSKVEDYLNSRATSGSVSQPMSTASKNVPISKSIPPKVNKSSLKGSPTVGQTVTKAFDNSTGQIKIGKFELGSFGRNAAERKIAQVDRFPESELDKTVKYIKQSFKASDNPSNYRKDNIAHISEMPNGKKRVIYTRLNKNGKEEIINWHKLNPQMEEKYIKTLKSYGASERT